MDPLLGRMNPGRTDPIPSMAKRQGSILSFFGNTNGPTQQKTTNVCITKYTHLYKLSNGKKFYS